MQSEKAKHQKRKPKRESGKQPVNLRNVELVIAAVWAMEREYHRQNIDEINYCVSMLTQNALGYPAININLLRRSERHIS